MSLLKKTVILSDRIANGYASVIRIGDDVGVKIAGESFTDRMRAVLRIENRYYYFPLQGGKTEKDLDATLESGDEIGCVVLANNAPYAWGGLNIPSQKTILEPQPETVKEEIGQPIIEEKEPKEQDNILTQLQPTTDDFYRTVRDRVEELFVVYPEEKNLSAIIPESQWVRVRYGKDEYYVVGKLYEGGKLLYLGYGVPGKEKIRPPKIADGIADWLPVEGILPYEGYWLFFQDAQTGKIKE